jgi:DNA repair exonuclease SbcCD ATPase subunit
VDAQAVAAAARQQQELTEERERAATLARDLAAARREMDAHNTRTIIAAQAADAAATRQQQELKDERERSAALTRDLAAARREIDRHNTATTTAAQAAEAAATRQQQELKQERERSAALTHELAAARREIQVHTERAAAAAGDSAVAAQAAKAAAMRQRQALEEERRRADALAGELAAARQAITATAGAADPPRVQITHVETEVTPAHATNNGTGLLDRPVSLEAQVSVEAKKSLTTLLTRANLFLSQGDISSARVVLERAIEMGSAEAGFRLAETYDPRVLASWRTLGTRGDPARARELYARAYAEGIQQAKDRMNALH